jgi:hypothetical protein
MRNCLGKLKVAFLRCRTSLVIYVFLRVRQWRKGHVRYDTHWVIQAESLKNKHHKLRFAKLAVEGISANLVLI